MRWSIARIWWLMFAVGALAMGLAKRPVPPCPGVPAEAAVLHQTASLKATPALLATPFAAEIMALKPAHALALKPYRPGGHSTAELHVFADGDVRQYCRSKPAPPDLLQARHFSLRTSLPARPPDAA